MTSKWTQKPEPVPPSELTKHLKVCLEHPRPVYFDGPVCPACEADEEFLSLTADMKHRDAQKVTRK